MRFFSNVIWLPACALVLMLAGCANQQGAAGAAGASSSRSDIVTESDEPDGRRRARLRLELASGYFEQGQTNVALDEIKQSLQADPSFGDAYNPREPGRPLASSASWPGPRSWDWRTPGRT